MSVASVIPVDVNGSMRIDTASSTVIYIGEATFGADENAAVWRIRKLPTVGTVLSIQWADGNQKFDNVWANRASLTYV